MQRMQTSVVALYTNNVYFIYKQCICLEEKQAHELMAVRVDQLWGPWFLRILVYLWSTMKSGWDGIITRFGNQLFQLPSACRCQIGEHICVFAQRVMWNGFWYNISIGKNKIRIIPATLNNCFKTETLLYVLDTKLLFFLQ